jgi:hypothetical protein
VLAGVVVAVVVVLVARGSSSTPSGASIAAPPSFGASLPVTTPSRAGGSPSGRAAGDAEFADAPGVQAVLTAATTAVQTVDSYDYRHLAADRSAGDKVSTGGFRAGYNHSLQVLAKSAPRSHTVQQAVVQKIAVAQLSATTAGVLVFGRLDVTSTADPAGSSQVLASGVSLQRGDGSWKISATADLADQGEFLATPPGNGALVAAVTAAGHEVVDLLSYRRTDFDADFDRALDGLTGALRTQQAQRRAELRNAMTRSQLDYAGQVRAIGIESASGSSVLLLVCATGYSVQAQGSRQQSGTERFEVGVQYVRGRWLVSEYLALPS